MNRQIAALSINKVQSLLFDVILSHTQEKQTEAATLNSIMTASKEISEDFVKDIQEEFGDIKNSELLNCSGVYIFQCTLEAECITEKLNKLFIRYYENSQGKKQLRYAHFPQESLDELDAIKKAKKLLQSSENFAMIVEKNKDKLFSFYKITENNTRPKLGIDNNRYPKFARDINKLFDSVSAENKNHFRIAIIKADLDGMGDMFQKIDNYDVYKNISDIVNRFVSLDGLHNTALKYFPEYKDGWIFPFYIAGDDIFFAVSIADMIAGIDVCRKIAADINKEIKEVTQDYNLALSVGVEVVFNKEPVRYYLNMVETQLKHAKKMIPANVLKPFIHSKIAIAGVTWLDIEIEEVKEYKRKLKKGKKYNQRCNNEALGEAKEINSAIGSAAIWRFFLDEVELLNYVKSNNKLKELVGTVHSYYSLLEKITNGDIHHNNIRYINHLLYHLMPEHMGTPVRDDLWKVELLINRGIIKQLYQKDNNGNVIQLNNDTKMRLEAYLRLMILFSDGRFQINCETIKGKSKKKGYNFRRAEQDNVRKELLSKPMKYLYDMLEKEHGSKLLQYFAHYEPYDKQKEQSNYLQRLSIDKSMFYKLRKIEKIDVKKAADMIELHNPDSIDEKDVIDEKDQVRQNDKKNPYYMYFDKDGFCKAAMECEEWTEDFIDSLMLLYEYNSLLRKYKSRCKDMKERSNR